jgi:hypothetical protein
VTRTPKPPNEKLRRARIKISSLNRPGHPMSCAEHATEVNRLLHARNILDQDVDATYLAKLEAGEYHWVRNPHRRWAIRTAVQANNDSEIGLYRHRASKKELDRSAATSEIVPPAALMVSGGLNTLSESTCPGSVETSNRDFVGMPDLRHVVDSDDACVVSVVIEGENRTIRVSRRALLQATQGAAAATILTNPRRRSPLPDAVRTAVLVTDFPAVETPAPHLSHVQQLVSRMHLYYQRASYGEAAAAVPEIMHAVSSLASDLRESGPSSATIAFAHLAVSKLALKFGDAQLAWIAADRAQTYASQTNNAALKQVVLVAVGSALLALPDHLNDAATLVERALCATTPKGREPAVISALGALNLLAAGIATRFEDHFATQNYLKTAGALADSLGSDRNELWTAFGPTNVLIHQVSVTAKHQPDQAIALGEHLDTTRLPSALASRRSQVHLDLATAFAHRPGRDASAVLHLLQVEQFTPQLLKIHPPARSLIIKLLARERTSATPGLRALATRAGVSA